MAVFRLDPDQMGERPAQAAAARGLTVAILARNARWFTRIRWIVVAVIIGFGAGGALLGPDGMRRFGLRAPGAWPWMLAAALVILNVVSIRWLRILSFSSRPSVRRTAANIWFQIVTDLLVLSVLVYHAGPTATVIPFAYLFHISLACIFFGRRDSFVVTLLSAAFYLATVALEWLEILPPAGLPDAAAESPRLAAAVAFVAPAVFVWLVVWYLTSSLSESVRLRDRNLAAANERITRADEAINRQMLRVTHDLKAPFSGIESNIQILKRMHWDDTTADVRRIIEKIEARSASLRARIGDILTLGSLRSAPDVQRRDTAVKLRDLLAAVARDLQGLAAEKKVSIALTPGDAVVASDAGQLKILFANLLANAVVYSPAGSEVGVDVFRKDGRITARVVDRGIGISAAALPHVFEDFYRAPEAAAVNPNSTGLGLAIIRQVARNLGLTLTVESEPGKGTTFLVTFRDAAGGENGANAGTRVARPS